MENFGKVALILAGGGAKGIVQCGMIRAFFNAGLDYHNLYGSSVGALNGLMVHQKDLSGLEEIWLTIQNSDVYTWYPWDIYRIFDKNSQCLYNSDPLYRYLLNRIELKELQSNPRAFHINTTSRASYKPVIKEIKEFEGKGDLATFLLASASPPVFFPPVRYRGDVLVDGGVLNNYSITQAIKDGCDTIFIMSFAVPEPKPQGNIKVALTETLSIAMYGYYDREKSAIEKINEVIAEGKAETQARDIRLIEISPDRALGIDLLDFNYKQDREELIEYGFNLAQKVLSKEV